MRKYIIRTIKDLIHLVENSRIDTRLHLGDILLAEGLITQEQLEQALQKQLELPGHHLGEILIDLGLCNSEQIQTALATKLGIPFVSLDEFEIKARTLNIIESDIAMNYNLLPLALAGNHLIVAMENPLDQEAIELLQMKTNLTIDAVMTSRNDISEALHKYYQQHDAMELDAMAEGVELDHIAEAADENLNVQSIAKEAQKKPIVRLVNAILMQGIVNGASDINIRPEKERVSIFYRLDGKLQFSRALPKNMLPAVVSRIKITARMDIAERRLPQDGHIRLVRHQDEVDLRVSVMPTTHGESVVIRILDPSRGLKNIEQLGWAGRDLDVVRKLLMEPNGLVLITGPTGSGKSTTIYALIEQLRKKNPHIITVEDPVEYEMEGIEQVNIHPSIGYTFAEALRHILRHDPDIIMIGEIRDQETVRIAVKAALTGHLVLSTLHTNDAVSAIQRLIDMDLEPYLLSATMRGVIAQRLLRLNCRQCNEEVEITPPLRKLLQVDKEERFYQGRGCEACNNSGYKGRHAITEILFITPEIAELISSKANYHDILQLALKQGMTKLQDSALQLAREGKTSLEEVLSVLM